LTAHGRQSSPPALKRTLGLWQVSVAGIGVILGAGVYALIGPAAGLAGDAVWLAFLVAGVTAGLTAYSYARLGAMQPKASPEFQYTALAFGPRIGFVAGWLMLVADVCAAAAVALGFGGYLAHFAGTPVILNAFVLLAAVGAFAYAGVAESVGLALVLTAVEAAGLFFVIAVGAPSWGRVDHLAAPPGGLGGISAAAALIFFAYLGFDELGNLAEEMREPVRDLPRALYIAVAATTLIYVAVALSATAAVGWSALAASPAPLAVVARSVFGARADALMTAIALAATANTVLLLLISAARSVYGMGVAGVLPARLGRVGGRAIPTAAAAAVLATAGALALLGDLRKVATLTDAAVLASFVLVNASLVWLGVWRRTGGGGARRAVDMVMGGAAVVLCGWLALHTGWIGLAAIVVILLVGACLDRGLWRAARRVLSGA
jgi:APA family basic amino acid/polyamine antiporter